MDRVSAITISIEEFEELMTCKRKLERIKELEEKNIESVKKTNALFNEKIARGEKESCKELLAKQNADNIIYLAKIAMIL